MITSGWWMGNWAEDSPWLAQVTMKQLGYLGSAVTWSHMAGLVESEHSSVSTGTSMWPQLQTQGLGFTSWTGYNNRMLEYLGCVHCRECFYFKSRKKKICFSLRCQITKRPEFCRNLTQFLASYHLFYETAHLILTSSWCWSAPWL